MCSILSYKFHACSRGDVFLHKVTHILCFNLLLSSFHLVIYLNGRVIDDLPAAVL